MKIFIEHFIRYIQVIGNIGVVVFPAIGGFYIYNGVCEECCPARFLGSSHIPFTDNSFVFTNKFIFLQNYFGLRLVIAQCKSFG